MSINILQLAEDISKNSSKFYQHDKLKAEDCSDDELLYATDEDIEDKEAKDWRKEQLHDWYRDRG